MMTFACPACKKTYTKDAALAGMQARCKQCGLVFLIPTPRAQQGSSGQHASSSWEIEDDGGAANETMPSTYPSRRPAAPAPAAPSRTRKKISARDHVALSLGSGAFGVAVSAVALLALQHSSVRAAPAAAITDLLTKVWLPIVVALAATGLGLAAWFHGGQSKRGRGLVLAKFSVALGALATAAWAGLIGFRVVEGVPLGLTLNVPPAWEENPPFESEQCNFRARFPSPPQSRVQYEDRAAGRVEITMFQCRSVANRAFIVQVLHAPGAQIAPSEIEGRLNQAMSSANQWGGAWDVQSKQPTTLSGGHRGYALEARSHQLDSQSGQYARLRMRVYVVGIRVYFVWAVGMEGVVNQDELEAFLNSFALLQPVAPGA